MPRTTRRNRSAAAPLMERGVYRPRCLTPEGFPYMFAIASDGRKILPDRPVYPFEDAESVADELWLELEEVDPLPRTC